MAHRSSMARLAWLAGLLLASAGALASGLQVSPVSLTLTPPQAADGLWLSNSGTDPLRAQVRVFRWSQVDGKDQLVPSRDLVISPPMLKLAVDARQLIRVIRTGAPPAGDGAAEASYRLIVDELPVDDQGKHGLKFVMRYSVPIFVEPQGGPAPTPSLVWSMQRDGGKAVLTVSNRGTQHAQLSQLSFIDKVGKRIEITPGLLGYVLPGSTMHWILKPPATAFGVGGTLEGMVNGNKASQKLALADRPR